MLMNSLIINTSGVFLGLINNLSSLYKILGLSVASLFILLRTPYLYGSGGFLFSVLVILGPLFLGILLFRLERGPSSFFSTLLPPGTPLGIAPFVCLAESISFLVRPMVMMLRPFLNITIGTLGGMSLGLMAMNNWTILLFLCVLFFYEIFVAVVHWFIVVNILEFSVDH
uniref:ATP synthase F0 subunit 6 n=1 Tax=Capsala martinieri TaxID=119074 RepID=UPI002008EC73|nr:ATP synthase F0 subunit 6 [Capsala martinieri]UOX29721.1 ATP synthase F0 subunit 6 [Capsala martinieri]